jgi:hypothetical protein
VLSVEDWAEIRRLHRAEGLSIRAIARVRGVSWNTVRNALKAQGPPRYRRRAAGSLVDVAEPRIRELLRADPRGVPATRDRGADRLGAFDQAAVRAGSGVAAAVFAAGSVGPHDVSGWGDRSARLSGTARVRSVSTAGERWR